MNIDLWISQFFFFYRILLIVYILMSFVPQARYSAIGAVLGKIAEPYLSVFRRFIPPIGIIDFSPIVALFVLDFVRLGVLGVVDFIRGLIAGA
jgi:YggT family protein